ncbi:MAG: amino acid adenylation domain-containing protein [Nostocales cyanobacterium]|nr:MAG: amino acid adenylation domain-containing protein [Nostocales cyanobacterium]
MENIEDLYELSPMQQGMLFHTLYTPGSEIYFEQLLCILSGDLNVDNFQSAWEQVVNRYSVLRSSFYWEEIEKPLQMVSKRVDIPWEKLDWRYLTTNEKQQKLEEFLIGDRQKGFVLDQPPLMRFTIIQLTEKTYQFVWSHHHILFDGWSMQIILKEVLTLYEAQQKGKHLKLQPVQPYREYIEWLQQQDINKAKQFWQQTLKGFETPTLIGKKGKEAYQKIYQEKHFQLSTIVTEKLQSLAKKHHLTLNNLVQGAWSLLISRYSREKDVVFGVTVSGRSAIIEQIEEMVGLFINTIPLRVKIEQNKELLTWLKDIQKQTIEQEQYSYFSLAEIQNLSDILPGTSLFDSILVFENYPVNSQTQEHQKTLEVSNLSCFERTNYPLTIVINPGLQLKGRFVYDSSVFDEQTINSIIAHFQNLLTGIADDLQLKQKISQISLLNEAEEKEIILLENHQNQQKINYQCIHVLFEEQVQKTPDKIAVVYQQEHLTYRELNHRANKLAHYLKSLGVKPETKVGICVERSLEMVIGILGILKAGGAYVPIDPVYPIERLAFMLEDTQTSILLTQNNLENRLPINQQTVVNFNRDGEKISAYSTDNLTNETNIENLAYVIYTSGSTGTPKGTEVPHRSVIGFMFGVDYIHLDETQIWLQHSSTSWDALTLEMWTPLLHGGCCVLYPEKIPTPENLVKIIQQQNINTLFLTTALFNLLIDEIPKGLSQIKQLLTGGEEISINHIQKALEILSATKIIHAYGPSECTVFTCCYQIPQPTPKNITSIPIGKPIGDRTVYILDDNLQRVPIGISGELYIGGASVARGYLNQPKLTGEKFIPNPFIQGDKLYKSGDLVRRLADGNIEFIGRIDNQVKIRGLRIEPSEIETILIQHPNIKQTVVIVRENETGNKLNKSLLAYLVVTDNSLTPDKLRKYLKEKLPDYMIPAAFVFLENLPLTPNGKINRRALPIPDTSQRNLETDFVPPSTSIEKEIATIWIEVLKIKEIGIKDNFFELGGHSLLATQAISRLKETFTLDFPLRYLFENPTIAELAQKVIEQQIEQAENDELAQILAEVDQLSAEEVQQQLLREL